MSSSRKGLVRYKVQPSISDHVAHEIDRRALHAGISRSGYVSQVLHDHVGAPRLTTHQRMRVQFAEELALQNGEVHL